MFVRIECIGALAVCGGLALGGCSSGARFAPAAPAVRATANNIMLRAPDSTLHGEVLTATNVSVTPPTFIKVAWVVKFLASGKAQGPLSGTFAATGSWDLWRYRVGGLFWTHGWGFRERFTIASRGRTIAGSIDGGGSSQLSTPFPIPVGSMTFGPAKCCLTWNHLGHGSVTTNRIRQGSLTERLQ